MARTVTRTAPGVTPHVAPTCRADHSRLTTPTDATGDAA
jgi:hypothetical protein